MLNIVVFDGGELIVVGNEKVIWVCLFDVCFFWDMDLKIKFFENLLKLVEVKFYEKLGLVGECVECLMVLLMELVFMVGVDVVKVKCGVEFVKVDLVLVMVFEFFEL